LLQRIINLIPAERPIETDLAATESFISAPPRLQTAAALCTNATRNQLATPSQYPVDLLLSRALEWC